MGYNELGNFIYPNSYQDDMVLKQGFDMTLFTPAKIDKVGYEDVDNHEAWIPSDIRGFINFNPKRGVYYHFNWFPENQEELVLGIFDLAAPVKVDVYIRTTNFQDVSPYGDFIFKVVKVFDEGKFKVLKRTCFLKSIVDKQLYEELVI